MTEPTPCPACGSVEHYGDGRCKPCKRAKVATWRANNLERSRASCRQWHRSNRDRVDANKANWKRKNPVRSRAVICAAFQRKKARALNAIPPWCDEEAVLTFYEQCPKGHHVDHVAPFAHPLVVGLHWHHNLQYLTDFDNKAKGRSLPADLSPEEAVLAGMAVWRGITTRIEWEGVTWDREPAPGEAAPS